MSKDEIDREVVVDDTDLKTTRMNAAFALHRVLSRREKIPWLLASEIWPLLNDTIERRWTAEEWGELEDVGIMRVPVLDEENNELGEVAESNEFIRNALMRLGDIDSDHIIIEMENTIKQFLELRRQNILLRVSAGDYVTKDPVALADAAIHTEFDTFSADETSLDFLSLLSGELTPFTSAYLSPEKTGPLLEATENLDLLEKTIKALDVFVLQIPSREWARVTSKRPEPGYTESRYLPCLAVERGIRALRATAGGSEIGSSNDLLLARLLHIKARLLLGGLSIRAWQVEAEEHNEEDGPMETAVRLLDEALLAFRSVLNKTKSKSRREQMMILELRMEVDRLSATVFSSETISGEELAARFQYLEESAKRVEDPEVLHSIQINRTQMMEKHPERRKNLLKFAESEELSGWNKTMCRYLIAFDSEHPYDIDYRIASLHEMKGLDRLRYRKLKAQILSAEDGFHNHERIFSQLMRYLSRSGKYPRKAESGAQLKPEELDSFVEMLYDNYITMISQLTTQIYSSYEGEMSKAPPYTSHSNFQKIFFFDRFTEESRDACVRLLESDSHEFKRVYGDASDDTRRLITRFAALALIMNSDKPFEIDCSHAFARYRNDVWDSALEYLITGRAEEFAEIYSHGTSEEFVVPTDPIEFMVRDRIFPDHAFSQYDCDLISLEGYRQWEGSIPPELEETYDNIASLISDMREVVSELKSQSIEAEEARNSILKIQDAIMELDTKQLVSRSITTELDEDYELEDLSEYLDWYFRPELVSQQMTSLRHHIMHLTTMPTGLRVTDGRLAEAILLRIRDLVGQAKKLGMETLSEAGLSVTALDLTVCMLHFRPTTPEEDEEYATFLDWMEELALHIMGQYSKRSRRTGTEEEPTTKEWIDYNIAAFHFISSRTVRFFVYGEDVLNEDLLEIIHKLKLKLVHDGISELQGYGWQDIAYNLAIALAKHEDFDTLSSRLTEMVGNKEKDLPALILKHASTLREHGHTP